MKITDFSSPIQGLYEAAKSARMRSYSPYSKFAVGAAIRTSDGSTFVGCNVENASFGATICAERAAILNAVGHLGKVDILEIMVVTQTDPPSPPCGLCRQVIAEFGENPKIYFANLEGAVEVMDFNELLPRAFRTI